MQIPSRSYSAQARQLAKLFLLHLGMFLLLTIQPDAARAQDPTDTLHVGLDNFYFSGTMVYVPAGGGAPVRLRMAMGIGHVGGVSARTERMAADQMPFRSWVGSARPEPEQDTLAEKFYRLTSGTKFPKAGDDPGHFHNTYAVPDGLWVSGLLQPVNGNTPQLALGQLNFRLQAHRVTGGGIDPDGSSYAFTLLEQTREPAADLATPTLFGPLSDGQLLMSGTLTVTHADGRIGRLPADGYITIGYNGNIYIEVPALLNGTYTGPVFFGQTTRSELRTVGDSMPVGFPFASESLGFIRPVDAASPLLPGVKHIGVAMHYGRLTGGCVADDGTAYSFMLTEIPPVPID